MAETVEEESPRQPSEKLPVSDFYKVIDHRTIFRSNKWWEAIVVIEANGSRSIAMYMWQFRDGKWKRKHKFHIKDLDEWRKVKSGVDELLPKLTRDVPSQL